MQEWRLPPTIADSRRLAPVSGIAVLHPADDAVPEEDLAAVLGLADRVAKDESRIVARGPGADLRVDREVMRAVR